MRTIKFRIWDIDVKDFLKEEAQEPYIYYSLGLPRTLSEVLNKSERFIVEEFTGLLDKNGREIYDGDIISYGNRHDGTPIIAQSPVMFERGGFCFKIDYDLTKCFFSEYATDDDHIENDRLKYIEVIGNCCENPELLNNATK